MKIDNAFHVYTFSNLGIRKAVVENPRKDTGMREIFRDEVGFSFVFLSSYSSCDVIVRVF